MLSIKSDQIVNLVLGQASKFKRNSLNFFNLNGTHSVDVKQLFSFVHPLAKKRSFVQLLTID